MTAAQNFLGETQTEHCQKKYCTCAEPKKTAEEKGLERGRDHLDSSEFEELLLEAVLDRQ